MGGNKRLQIGLLALRWEYFDSILPSDFLQEKESLTRDVVKFLSDFGDVVSAGLVDNEQTGRRHAELFRQHQVNCIVVFVHMATPGAYAWEALREFRVPILIWNAHLDRTIPQDYDMPDLCRKSSNVGTLMLTNVLLRHERSFEVVTGPWKDAKTRQRIGAFLRAASVRARLRQARIGVLGGSPMAGYLDVEVDPQRLQDEIGPKCIFYSPETWFDYVHSIQENVEPQVDAVRRGSKIMDLSDTELNRSVRVALALERLVADESLDACTINCHSEFFRHDERVGVVACLGASRLTTAGTAVACTGDILTTVGMLLGKWLGSAVLYCECDLIDYEAGVMAMANTGECDYQLREPGTEIEVYRNPHFGGGNGCIQGACHSLKVRPGRATLMGFSPNAFAKGGWSLIVAPGEVTEAFHEKLIAGNCEFRFDRKPVEAAFDAWVNAGATHHGALCTGDLSQEIDYLAKMIGIEGTIIS